MINVQVRYRLGEHLQILIELALNAKCRDAMAAGKPVVASLGWFRLSLLRAVGSLIFLVKFRRMGICDVSIDTEGVTRASKAGPYWVPWRDVFHVHKLSAAYLVEKENGGMSIPFRVLTDGQRQALEALAGHRLRVLGNAGAIASEDVLEMAWTLLSEAQAQPPHTDAEAMALIAEIGALLAEPAPESAPDHTLRLYALAANQLTQRRGEASADDLRRVLARLDGIGTTERTAKDVLTGLVYMRATAYVRAANHVSAEQLTDAIGTCREALQQTEWAQDATCAGPLAFNLVRFTLRRDGWPEEESNLVQMEAWLTQALKSCRWLGKHAQMRDAGRYLRQAAMQRLRRPDGCASALQRTFEMAERCINAMMAPIDELSDTAEWAATNLEAGWLASLRPGRAPSMTSGDSTRYFCRAMHAYQRLGDKACAAMAAHEAMNAMDTLPPDWPAARAARYAHFSGVARADASLTRVQLETLRLKSANAWMKVPADPAARARARKLAEPVAEYAEEAGDVDLAAQAFRIIGACLLGPTDESEVADAPESTCMALRQASTALESARRHVRASGSAGAMAQIARLRATALGRRIAQCGELALSEQYFEAQEEAIGLSTGDESATAHINLVAVAVTLAERGRPWPRERARRALAAARAEPLAGRHVLSRHVREIGGGFEAVDLFGSSDPSGSVSDAPADTPLSLAVAIRDAVTTEADGEEPLLVVTLLLGVPVDRAQAWLELSGRTGGSCYGALRVPCPRCQAPWEWDLPISVDMQESGEAFARFQAMAAGEARCGHCGVRYQLQSTCLMTAQAFPGRSILIYPDGLADSQRLQHAQAWLVIERSRQLAGSVDPPHRAMPWTGVFGGPPGLPLPVFAHRHREVAVVRAAQGIASGDGERLLQGLRRFQQLSDGAVALSADEAAALIESLADRPVAKLADLAQAVVQTLAAAFEDGPEQIVEDFAHGWQRVEEQRHHLEEALRVAGSSEERLPYLRRFIAEIPDYAPDRSEALMESVVRSDERIFQNLESKGFWENQPIGRALGMVGLQNMRKMVQEKIAMDRRWHTSAPAKAVIAAHLSEGTPFVLLLRAFSVDTPFTEITSPSRGRPDLGDDPFVRQTVYNINTAQPHVVDAACAALPPGIEVLTVANLLDPMPPRRPRKLFVTDRQWQPAVFALIGEARAILLVTPSDAVEDGLSQEISAIHALGREGRTIIVLSEAHTPTIHLDGFLERTQRREPEANDHDASIDAFRRIGFEQVITLSSITADPALLARPLQALWDLA